MSEQVFRFRKESSIEVKPLRPLSYHTTGSGITVTAGTLPGCGFAFGHGITVPEEIDGIPVTELDVSCSPVDYVDGPSLKRVTLRFSKSPWEKEVSFGALHGPMESLSIVSESPVRIRGLYSNTLRVLSVSAPEIHISQERFSSCPNLESVSFSGAVCADDDWDGKFFPQELFRDCRKLTRVSGSFFGDALLGSTFSGCVSLASTPNFSVSRLMGCEFANCSSLRSLHLSNGLKSIGSSCFAGCTALEDLYIPDTVTSLGSFLFDGCKNLKTVHYPDALTEIPLGTFRGCTSLQKCFLSDSLQKIGSSAFEGCSALKNPWIPKNLTEIGASAFAGCRSITQVMLPPAVTKIGENAFADCPNLVIKGVPGTFAETFAHQSGLSFRPSF